MTAPYIADQALPANDDIAGSSTAVNVTSPTRLQLAIRLTCPPVRGQIMVPGTMAPPGNKIGLEEWT